MPDFASLHPLVVHAPLVLLPIAVLFSLLHEAFPRAGLRITALLLLIGGVATASLAEKTGEEAARQARQRDAAVIDIKVDGTVPQAVAGGKLLHTHSQLAEWTTDLYVVLLLTEGAILFIKSPMYARWKYRRSLSASAERVVRTAWLLIAVTGITLVVLTGHYGGALVFDHGIGLNEARPAQTAR